MLDESWTLFQPLLAWKWRHGGLGVQPLCPVLVVVLPTGLSENPSFHGGDAVLCVAVEAEVAVSY